MATLEPRRTTERLPFELDGHRLMVATQSEKEFLAGFEEFFWVLMHSERTTLIVDLSHTNGLDLTAYQMIALNLFEIGNKGKRLTLRIPETLEKFFRQAGLHRAADIEVVWHLGHPSRQAPTDAASDAEASAPSTSPSASTPAAGAGATATTKAGGEASSAAGASTPSEPLDETPEEFDFDAVPAELRRRIGAGALVDSRTQQQLDLPDRTDREFSIGRTPDNHFPIASPLVSRKHCRFYREGDRYFIVDLGSGNGTYVNGHRLPAEKPRPIFHGDRIIIAVTRQFPHGAKALIFHQEEF